MATSLKFKAYLGIFPNLFNKTYSTQNINICNKFISFFFYIPLILGLINWVKNFERLIKEGNQVIKIRYFQN